jgi:hypothetical protein
VATANLIIYVWDKEQDAHCENKIIEFGRLKVLISEVPGLNLGTEVGYLY